MEKTLKKILTLVLSAAVLLSTLMCAIPVTAAKTDPATDFMVGKYGIMVHYLHDMDTVQTAVNSFNAENFAKQVNNAGAKWVLFTLTQSNGVYNIPMDEHLDASGNAIFADTDVTVAEGRKDIVEELYDALTPYGIKLMLYWIPGAPSGTDETTVALAQQLGAVERVDINEDGKPDETGEYVINETTVNNMSSIMASVSAKYGEKVAGWWIDACYDSTGFNDAIATQEAAALRTGNENAAIAFNRGTKQHDAYYDVESYAAGEICHGDRTDPTKDNYEDIYMFSADSRWTDNGFQSHYLTFLGTNWTKGDERYETAELVDHVYNNILKNGGAMTFDMSCSADGTLDTQQFNQIVALSKVVYPVVDTAFSVNFEKYNPFGWVSNVYTDEGAAGATDHHSPNSEYVRVVTGEEALNGNASLKVVPKDGNNRTDVLPAVTVANTENENGISHNSIKFDGNPDFDKADAENAFDKVSGIMLRLKIANDSDTAHIFKFNTYQDNVTFPTSFGRAARLYSVDGTYLGEAASAEFGLSGIIPAGFDGFVFIPFANARAHIRENGTEYLANYDDNPDLMVDFSKPFRVAIVLNDATWNGTEVYLDDIGFYYGNTDGNAWDTMRELGYDVIYHTQPDVYELPLDFEKGQLPVTSGKQFYTKYSDYANGIKSGYPDYSNLTTTELTIGEEALNGKASFKINMASSPYKTNDNYDKMGRMESSYFTVKGVEGFSKAALLDIMEIDSTTAQSYALLKVRIKTPNDSEGPYNFRFVVKQDNAQYWLCYPANNKNAYNLDGTLNTAVTYSGQQLSIPAGFNGYIYLSVSRLYNPSTYGTVYAVGTDNGPDFSQDFELSFNIWGSNWEGKSVEVDDIDLIINDMSLSKNMNLNFEEPTSAMRFYGMNSSYGVVEHSNYIMVTDASEALNGNGSLKFTTVSNGTNIKYYSGPRIVLSGTGEDNAKGIMLRVKLVNDTATDPHTFFGIMLTKDGKQVNETLIGLSEAKYYHADGTPYSSSEIALNGNSYALPVGFDGFVFFPFDKKAFRTSGEEYIDQTKTYTMQVLFWNSTGTGDGVRTWDTVESVLLDDISYYTVADEEAGLTDAEAWDIMRGLGYNVIHRIQPDVYTLPLTADDGMKPITTITGTANTGATYNCGTASLTTDADEVLNGKASIKLATLGAEAVPSGATRLAKVTTNIFNVNGIADLSTQKIKAAASNDYAYIKLRIKLPETESGLQLIPAIAQNGSYWVAIKGVKAYNTDGSYNTQVSANTLSINFPVGFDGYIEIPVYSALAATFSASGDRNLIPSGSQSGTVADYVYQNETSTAPELSNDFGMFFQFIGGGQSLANANIYLDDISVEINEPAVVEGDINGDNEANGDDLVIMQKQLLGVDTTYEKKCDIKEDNAVNILDFIKLKKIIGK